MKRKETGFRPPGSVDGSPARPGMPPTRLTGKQPSGPQKIGDPATDRAPGTCVLLAGALGDFLLALPALHILRHVVRGAKIEIIGNANWLPLALASGAVDRTCSLNDLPLHAGFQESPAGNHPLWRFLARYDLILSWFGDREGLWEKNLRKAVTGQVYVFPFHRREEFTGHVSRYFLETLRQTGMALPEASERPWWPPSHRWHPSPPSHCPGQRQPRGETPRLCMHPGSGSEVKNWPPERFLEVARRLTCQGDLACTVLLGEAEQRQLPFWRQAESPGLAVRSGLNLLEVSGMLSRAPAYLGHDSGITHLAASLGVPTLALFGPTDPLRWSPLGPRVHTIRKEVPCRPCAGRLPARCEHRECLLLIEAAEVAEVLRAMLAGEMPPQSSIIL